MSIIVRTAIPEQDYSQLAPLLNSSSVWDAAPVTAATLHEWDAQMSKGQITRRSIAVTETGESVGYAEATYLPWKPVGHFWLWVMVHPTRRKQGIGKVLYEDALQFAQTNGATHLTSSVRDTEAEALHFAEQRNFNLERHQFQSTLALKSFDENHFAGIIEAVEATGIRFVSLAHIGDSLEIRQKLYAINRSTYLDIPGTDGTFPSFEQSTNLLFGAPWFRAEGQLIALDGDTYVGYCSVIYFQETNSMYNLMTGVDRAYRGRKIALALKLSAIRFAKSYGADTIHTNNDSQNEPMLAINRKLGYQPQPGHYQLVQHL
jgi:GNAT superfamily N-acetyltransferase